MAATISSTFSYSFLILATISPCQSLRIRRPSIIPTSPRIWPSSFYEVDSFKETQPENEFRTQTIFQNEFILKNGSDYVILDATESIVFTCQSSVPVRWSFTHENEVERANIFTFGTTMKRTSRFATNKPVNRYFETFLSIQLFYMTFLSVNLTCTAEEAKNSHLESSSIHVFYAGTNRLERASETIEIYVPPTKKSDTSGDATVIFPCRPATPNLTVLLEKQVENQSNQNKGNSSKEWVNVQVPSKYATFDPKRGFILLKDMLEKWDYIFGLYRCFSVDDVDQIDDFSMEPTLKYVYINVTSKVIEQDSAKETKFETIFSLKNNASLTYRNQSFGNHPIKTNSSEDDITKVLICCSGVANSHPYIETEKCDNPLQCELLKRKMARRSKSGRNSRFYDIKNVENRSDCSNTFVFSDDLAVCKGETITFVDKFVEIFSGQDATSKNIFQNSKIPYLTSIELQSNMKNVPISQKILLTIGYPITSLEVFQSQHHYIYNSIRFNLHKDQYYDYDSLEVDYEQSMYLEPALSREFIQQKHDEKRTDKIAEYPRDHFYEGEPLVFVCLGWKHLYAEGAHLSISWTNGTTSSVESRKSDKMHNRMVYFDDRISVGGINEFSLVHRFSREMIASMEMSSVECWMPQWNSSGWDKISRNLTILEPHPPRFVGGEEIVYFYLGDGPGGQLECDIADGAPEPRLNVNKDGKNIFLENKFNWNSDVSNILNISKIEGGKENNSSNVTFKKIQITFGQVTHEIQGVYECTAENLRGKVSRRFRVIVLQKRNVAMTVVFVIMAISGLLVFGMGLRHWWQQKSVQSLRRTVTS